MNYGYRGVLELKRENSIMSDREETERREGREVEEA